MTRPSRGRTASLADHPSTERHDKVAFLGDRNELRRWYEAAVAMMPAQKRLRAGDLVLLEVQNRLEIELEIALFERVAQVCLESAALLHARIELFLVEEVGATTELFDTAH